MKIERSNIIRRQIRIRLFRRFAVYLDLPIRITYLPPKLGGVNRHKVTNWTPEKKKEMSDYMKRDWKRRKAVEDHYSLPTIQRGRQGGKE